MFSQLIQIPGMRRTVINMPDYINEAEQIVFATVGDNTELNKQALPESFLTLTNKQGSIQ